MDCAPQTSIDSMSGIKSHSHQQELQEFKMVVLLNQTTTLYLVIAAKVNIDLYDFIIDLYMTRPH